MFKISELKAFLEIKVTRANAEIISGKSLIINLFNMLKIMDK
jgi:hypothetical protein